MASLKFVKPSQKDFRTSFSRLESFFAGEPCSGSACPPLLSLCCPGLAGHAYSRPGGSQRYRYCGQAH